VLCVRRQFQDDLLRRRSKETSESWTRSITAGAIRAGPETTQRSWITFRLRAHNQGHLRLHRPAKAGGKRFRTTPRQTLMGAQIPDGSRSPREPVTRIHVLDSNAQGDSRWTRQPPRTSRKAATRIFIVKLKRHESRRRMSASWLRPEPVARCRLPPIQQRCPRWQRHGGGSRMLNDRLRPGESRSTN